MDDIERAQEREQRDRAICLPIARNAPQRDFEAEVCPGTKTNYGRTCEAWRECLQDLQKRERAARQ